MCRLVAGYAWSREGAGLLARLAYEVALAAQSDPLLAAVTGGEDRHCHGYGFVLAYRGPGGGAWRVVYERFDAVEEGVGEEEACRANLEASLGAAERLRGLLASASEAFLVFHVRRAGRREPRGSLNTHPYRVSALHRGGAVELYVAHNGGVRKEELASLLGLEAASYTDSHLLALWLAGRMEEGLDPGEALAAGYRFVKSGYDVAVLGLRDRLRGVEPWLVFAGGMAGGLDEARVRYYAPYGFESAGAAGYVSSTVAERCGGGCGASFRRLGGGVYAVTRGGLRRLRGLG